MASLAATRLFAAGGAGGVALTAWALRRAGMERKDVATRMIAFLALTYAIYMLALIACGFGLRWGFFHGKAPFALTIIPAWIGVVSFLIFLAIAFLPKDIERRMATYQPRSSRMGRVLGVLATVPARLGDGARFALKQIRHPDLALLGTVGWWGFNIAVLYACFEAFGARAAAGRRRAGLLRRDAREPAAAARWHRRGGRWDDRDVRGVRRVELARGRRRAVVPSVRVLAAVAARRGGLLPAAAHGRALASGAAA